MKSNLTIIGVVLALIGGGMLAYQGFYVTKEESVLKVGPLDVQAKTRERVTIPPAIGWICVIAGVAMIVSGAASKRA